MTADTVVVPPCVTELRDLYTQIKTAIMGQQVTSVGHKGRSVSYTPAKIDDMIKFYAQLRAACPKADAFEVPKLAPLDKATIARGAPVRLVLS
jgi:hypothetical protein